MAIKQYSLKADGAKQLAPGFKVREFRCRDGSDVVMVDEALVVLLQCIREHFGKAVTITSGYRTEHYNNVTLPAKGIKTSRNSQHLLGRAADIQVAGVSVEDVAAYAESLLPIESTTVEQLVTAGITTVAALVSWWNNNSFTAAALEADKTYDRIKQQGK